MVNKIRLFLMVGLMISVGAQAATKARVYEKANGHLNRKSRLRVMRSVWVARKCI